MKLLNVLCCSLIDNDISMVKILSAYEMRPLLPGVET